MSAETVTRIADNKAERLTFRINEVQHSRDIEKAWTKRIVRGSADT